jgi:uncharacterized phage protein gp47/JayE
VPFERPTLATLVARIRADFRSRLGISGQLLRRAMADVLAATWAGAQHMLHGHLDWLSKQLFPTTSEREFLLEQGSMYGLSLIPASYATGIVTATGTNGSLIPEDSILVRDDGFEYRVTADATISGGSAPVFVEAVLAGADGDLDSAEILTFSAPIFGVDSTTVSGGISGGADIESTEAFRSRFLLRLREPPQGGAEQDYIAWALSVAGVTRVWVYPNEDGLGTVTVRFVRDLDGSIFPDAGEVAAVQAVLEEERPVTVEVTAEAPTSSSINFTISVFPDTTDVHNAVIAELTDLLFREAEPGDGAGRGTIFLSHILVAIGIAEGVEDFTLTAPAADVVPTLGQLKVVGTFTWV